MREAGRPGGDGARSSRARLLRSRLYSIAKRVVDVLVAATALVVLSPVLVAVVLAVRVQLGGPVVFGHERAGRDGRPFVLLKFRSMLPVDAAAGLVDDADRLTPFGRLLRSTSLDELPGLVNVLRGDIGLVGPRPLPTAYLERYSATQARRHEVRPGMTGLAQVSGRNGLDWADRLRLDVQYVDQASPWLDLVIIARTVGVVLGRDGISAPGQATMTEFAGSAVRAS